MSKSLREWKTSRNNSSRLPVSKSQPSVIALLTDFGTSDYFVGAVKGVILSINPSASIVDISHDLPPQDIEAGAFTLFAAHSSFPRGTIFIGVIDPGVGSSRRPIVVEAGKQFFVGPDNGLFTYIFEQSAHKTFHLTAEKYFRHPVSPTFHGRDIFAPVAGHLSTGMKPNDFGPEIGDEVRLLSLNPVRSKDGVWKAKIIHIDTFGNCITNIRRPLLGTAKEDRIKLEIKGKTVNSIRKFFSDASVGKKLFALWGSAGFLEIAAQNRSAADLLKAKCGDVVRLVVR